MKVFWAPKTRSIRALWMLEEAGVQYDRTQIDISDPASKANPSLRAASPMGKVPALEDGPVRIWDSGAICAYLADQYPSNNLAPLIGDPQRGEYLMWLMFTNSVIEPSMAEKFANLQSKPAQYGWGSWDQMLITLRQGLERGPWILGQRFSAADVMLGMSCQFLQQFKMIGDEPILAAYVSRCAARPAFQRAMAIEAAG